MNSLVTCRGLVWHSGDQLVLDQLDLELQSGESLALLGSSGSGKSTLLRIIAGLEMPEDGEVMIDRQCATQGCRLVVPPHRRQVAMLFQDRALWPNLTVAANVALGMSGLRLSRRSVRSRVEAALETCGIRDLEKRLPGTLSGGEQQRAALARALSVQPKLLLLDEPFGGLDLVTRESIIHEVDNLRSQHGFALILVTHDPTEIRVLCNSLCVLEGGRIVDRRRLDETASAPQSTLGQLVVKLLQTEHRLDSYHTVSHSQKTIGRPTS